MSNESGGFHGSDSSEVGSKKYEEWAERERAELIKRFCGKFDSDRIKINQNENPIKMDLFLSFLMVDTERQKDFLGSCSGWTRLIGKNGLEIKGGKVGGVEYLHMIQYGENLDNPWNNYVNPFYLFEIMNEDGKKYFIDYYIDDIKDGLNNASVSAVNAKLNLQKANSYKEDISSFWERFGIHNN